MPESQSQPSDVARDYIRILHLSDLHFGQLSIDGSFRHVFESPDSLRTAILSTLHQHFTRTQKPFDVNSPHVPNTIDYVVISGDLVCKGADEAQHTTAFNQIKALLDNLNLDVARLILVPGNHDVDRGDDSSDPYKPNKALNTHIEIVRDKLWPTDSNRNWRELKDRYLT